MPEMQAHINTFDTNHTLLDLNTTFLFSQTTNITDQYKIAAVVVGSIVICQPLCAVSNSADHHHKKTTEILATNIKANPPIILIKLGMSDTFLSKITDNSKIKGNKYGPKTKNTDSTVINDGVLKFIL